MKRLTSTTEVQIMMSLNHRVSYLENELALAKEANFGVDYWANELKETRMAIAEFHSALDNKG